MFELLTFLAVSLVEIMKSDLMMPFWIWIKTDFWNFSHSFFYGSLGGLTAVLMSHIQNESSLVDLKNHLIISSIDKPDEEKINDAFKKIRIQSNAYIIKTTYTHFLVGGISGMIAVSAFNPKADELQTFSIAIIAGVSGFAFLKRSALIDDGNSDNLTNVEKASLESYIKSVNEVNHITTIFTSDTSENPTPQTDPQEETVVKISDETLESFIVELREQVPNITEKEIEHVKELSKQGLSIVEILERIRQSRN